MINPMNAMCHFRSDCHFSFKILKHGNVESSAELNIDI